MTDLKDMLAAARFYGAKSEPIDDVEVVRSAPAVGHTHQLVRAHHGGTTSLYQVLLDAAGDDVLADNATALGEALASGRPAGLGTLHGDASALAGLPGRPHGGEQSNTSLIFGETMIVKYFRRLEPGPNPDVELLSAITDCPHVAPCTGWVTGDVDGEQHTLAMLQDYVPEAVDGWRFALGFTRIGAPFAPEATLIGEATRKVHDALAQAFPREEVPVSRVVAGLEEHLGDMVARAGVLQPFAAPAREFYRQLLPDQPEGDTEETVSVQRIHGDLHLGQLLRDPDRYVLIDFEGEPARPLPERRRPDSPLRDVAGMLRSLDYAAHADDAPDRWTRKAAEGLLAGYGVDSSLLLQAYVLDKALYEVAYETNHRPDWVDIPLGAVKRLLGSSGAG